MSHFVSDYLFCMYQILFYICCCIFCVIKLYYYHKVLGMVSS